MLVSNHRLLLIVGEEDWGFLALVAACWVMWSLLEERGDWPSEGSNCAQLRGTPTESEVGQAKHVKESKEPGACSRADSGRQLGKTGSRKSQAPGVMRFFSPKRPRGDCANFSTVQISVSSKKQLSYWTKIRPRAKGSHYKDTVDREGLVYRTFLFIMCLILIFLSFKKFILVHIVMQPGSRACKAQHGSGVICSEK